MPATILTPPAALRSGTRGTALSEVRPLGYHVCSPPSLPPHPGRLCRTSGDVHELAGRGVVDVQTLAGGAGAGWGTYPDPGRRLSLTLSIVAAGCGSKKETCEHSGASTPCRRREIAPPSEHRVRMCGHAPVPRGGEEP